MPIATEQQGNAVTTPEDEGFYIVRSTTGRSDQTAIDWLERLGIEVYYPRVMEMRKVPRRKLSASQRRAGVEVKKPQLSPLFPRYIFARFGMARHSWRDIFKFAGISGMVCNGDLPVMVPASLIAKIRARENDGVVAGTDSVRAVFGIGDHVTVTDGPFASFPGIVERGFDISIEELEPNLRIKVAVNIFGRATPVELEVWQVAKH
jgi:transcription termination/antitermination protein NusG